MGGHPEQAHFAPVMTVNPKIRMLWKRDDRGDCGRREGGVDGGGESGVRTGRMKDGMGWEVNALCLPLRGHVTVMGHDSVSGAYM